MENNRVPFKNCSLPKTVIFVDYESWFWGLYNKGETPNVKELIKKIKQRANLEQIYFFGDFTKEEMQNERMKLRTVTNDIIDCANQQTRKDYTDFIMLDHIYRTHLSRPEIQQYILITGDGHFHSVAAYLNTFADKIVGVYGVQGSLNNQLKECATWWEEITPKNNINEYCPKVLETINWAERSGIIPFFGKTVEGCSKYFGLDKIKVAAALSKLIEEGFIEQTVKTLTEGYEVRVLVTKWDLLLRQGIWKPNKIKKREYFVKG